MNDRAGFLRMPRIAQAARITGIAREVVRDFLDASRRHLSLPAVERRGRYAGPHLPALNLQPGMPE